MSYQQLPRQEMHFYQRLKKAPADSFFKFVPKHPFCIIKFLLACSLGSANPAQAFIDPSTTPIYDTGTNSQYSQYQNPIYTQPNPYIVITAVTYGIGTGIETANVGYSGTYNSNITGAFGLWQVGDPTQLTTSGALNFWANNGNNPVTSLSFGLGDAMKSYLGLVSRRVTDGNIVQAFMWTRIDEQLYWSNFNPATLEAPSAAISTTSPDPSTEFEQYLLWIRPITAADEKQQQINSAPVLTSLEAELADQIANGGGTAPPDPVPGPLPIFGIGMAFNYSRRLRRRTCNTDKSKAQD